MPFTMLMLMLMLMLFPLPHTISEFYPQHLSCRKPSLFDVLPEAIVERAAQLHCALQQELIILGDLILLGDHLGTRTLATCGVRRRWGRAGRPIRLAASVERWERGLAAALR